MQYPYVHGWLIPSGIRLLQYVQVISLGGQICQIVLVPPMGRQTAPGLTWCALMECSQASTFLRSTLQVRLSRLCSKWLSPQSILRVGWEHTAGSRQRVVYGKLVHRVHVCPCNCAYKTFCISPAIGECMQFQLDVPIIPAA